MANWIKKCFLIWGLVLCFMLVVSPITYQCNADWGSIKEIFDKSNRVYFETF